MSETPETEGNLELVNLMRQVSLDQFHKSLDKLQVKCPEAYGHVRMFLLGLKPEPKFKT